jgi:putative CocE/NonD family hydrolase
MADTAAHEVIHEITELHDMECPMRDGVNLATDVFMPAEGGPFPTVLIRIPYDRGSDMSFGVPTAIYLAQRGYAVVMQDTRGRFDSEGKWYPFVNEVDDGYDAIEWVGKQPWSNGKIATSGASYFGLTQWQAAQGNHPNHIASVPRVAYSNTYHNWVYTGGAFQLAFNLTWSIAMSTRTGRKQYMWYPTEMHLSTLMWHLPLITSDEAAGRNIRHFKDWVNHPSYDDYWRSMRPVDEHYPKIETAAYSMAGWFDVFLQGSLNNFMGMTKHGKTEKARRNQKIIVGPWIHRLGELGTESITGDIDFGPDVELGLQEQQARWYDYWLKGEDNGIMDEPRVKVFVMGANRWREADDWPIPGTQYTPHYLHSNGNANSLFGDGFLNRALPGDELPDRYTYDPEHPVMTIGGST